MNDKLKILKDLKNHLEKNSTKHIVDVILFGSQATGKIKEDSDFDVLIVLDDVYNRKDEDNILDICYDIDLQYNILIDAHIISKSEIHSLRGRQAIYYNALTHGVYA